MSFYSNYFTRSATGPSKCTGTSFCCYYAAHRRFYADQQRVNHYDVLGIKRNASAQEIKAAFYELSKKHHPDVNPDDKTATGKFSTISNAYDVLGDPIKRRDYDNELSSRISTSDPHVTYNYSSVYAQRARAYRPSARKPPSSSTSSSSGFHGAEHAFGNSRSTNYGTFDKEQYDRAFGQYRGPLPRGRSNIYDFDEFYRVHFGDFQAWDAARKEAQERLRREQQTKENKREQKVNRSTMSKLSLLAAWLSLGIFVTFLSNLLHDMNFQKPADELHSRFYIVSKSPKTKSHSDSSSRI